MNKNMYLVLSVKDIKGLLKAAKASQAANRPNGRNKDNHCIILHGLHTSEEYPDQIGYTSFANAVEQVEAEVKRTIKSRG